ncbi:MAG: LysR family transcriptional regulator [Actinomycetota bacterium]|nr:LysR family transcriptional regulator [Actinomycetota bacterium]
MPGSSPPPSLEALRLFLAVARLGSVSRAAAACGITQPSATARLSHLETQLGVVLLERGATGSRPTEAGALVAEWATTLLEASDHFGAAVGALRRERTGRLRVSASYTVAEYLLPGWLARFRGRHPAITVELDVANSTQVVEQLHAGRAELGFVELPEPPRHLEGRTVATDELVVVVRPDHPWAGRRRPVPAATLATTPLVVREIGSGTRESLERALATAGYGPVRPLLELGSTSAVKAAVLDGAGPAVVSGLAVRTESQIGQLVTVAVSGLDLSRELRAVWLPGHALVPTAAAFLAELDGIARAFQTSSDSMA